MVSEAEYRCRLQLAAFHELLKSYSEGLSLWLVGSSASFTASPIKVPSDYKVSKGLLNSHRFISARSEGDLKKMATFWFSQIWIHLVIDSTFDSKYLNYDSTTSLNWCWQSKLQPRKKFWFACQINIQNSAHYACVKLCKLRRNSCISSEEESTTHGEGTVDKNSLTVPCFCLL